MSAEEQTHRRERDHGEPGNNTAAPDSTSSMPFGSEVTLHQQGCTDPLGHLSLSPYPNYEISRTRLQALREIHRCHRYRPLMDSMLLKLPKELIIQVFEWVVLMSQRHLSLDGDRALQDAARALAGHSASTDVLTPLVEQAILDHSIFRCPIRFRNEKGSKVVHLPPVVASLSRFIRHLELRISFDIPRAPHPYPLGLYSATAGMPSLHAEFSGLRSLHILLSVWLTIDPRSDPQSHAKLDNQCRKGFTGVSTFRKSIELLLDAARATEPALQVTLEFAYDFYDNNSSRLPTDPVVEAGSRPASEVVREADAKHSGKG